MSKSISCPNCHTEIEISEVLQSQMSEQIRVELESELASQRAEVAGARQQLSQQASELSKQRESLADQITAGVAAARVKIMAEAKQQATESLQVELQDRDLQLNELQTKLAAAQTNELELRKRERHLQSQAEELQLTVARQLDAEREKVRQAAMQQFADEHELKDAEKQQMIAGLRRQIDELKRKAEQGSVQVQGDVQEVALKDLLETAFPRDLIERVGKGRSGADTTQRVLCPQGASCGSILWESKRTKSFSNAWLPKLRDDQRAARASVSVIVTETMPEGVDTFALIDGVWVCSWKCAKALAMVLRAGLVEVAKSKLAAQGQTEKMELVYNYLSSPEFRQRVAGVVEAFVGMRTDLDSERRAMKRIWSKREKQIDRAASNTAGLYGDLQGIIGASLPVVEGLEMPLVEAANANQLAGWALPSSNQPS